MRSIQFVKHAPGGKYDSTDNPSGKTLPSGVLEGNGHQLINQLVGVAIAWVIAIVGTLVLLFIVDKLVGLRVSEEHETQGLDLSQHGEEGYDFGT